MDGTVSLCLQSPLAPRILLSPFQHSSLNPERMQLMKISHLALSFQSLSRSKHCLALGSCISSHILQEEDSVMKAEKDTVYKYIRLTLGVILLLYSFSKAVVCDLPLSTQPV